MCEVYKYFSQNWMEGLDYSEDAMLELYLSESYGDVKCSPLNGYSLGKKGLNLTVAMWLEDIDNGILKKYELYDDPQIPNWWLDKLFRRH